MQTYAIYHNDQRLGTMRFIGHSMAEVNRLMREEFGLKYARNVEIIKW